MKTKLSFVLVLLLFAVGVVVSPWGRDILIYDGPVSCFDVDAANDDGVMYVAFQKDDSRDAQIYVYRSEDGGMTWADMRIRIGYQFASGGWPLKRKIKIVNWYDDLFVFWIGFDGTPMMAEFRSDSYGHHYSTDSLGYFDGDPLGFDTAYIPSSDLLVFAFYTTLFNEVRVRFIDPFSEEPSHLVGDWYYYRQPTWASTEVDVAVGSDSRVYVAGIGADNPDDPSTAEIVLHWTTLSGESADWGHSLVTDNNYRDSDPHVVASTDGAAPAVWTSFTAIPLADANLLIQGCSLSPELSYCGDAIIGASRTVSEYWGDMKAYITEPNRWVNIVWIEDDGAFRKVYWAWSSGDSPLEWRGDVVINDHDAHSWPAGLAPRLVFSPGVPERGGAGVVYVGHGGQNLYFDAPWNTAIVPSGRTGGSP